MKWWLSFADDSGFRGACIVSAPSFMLAHTAASMHGCNPGGEMRGWELPEDAEIGERWMNRLLSIDDVRAFDLDSGGDGHAVNPDTGDVK